MKSNLSTQALVHTHIHKITAFWDVTSCNLLDRYQHLGRTLETVYQIILLNISECTHSFLETKENTKIILPHIPYSLSVFLLQTYLEIDISSSCSGYQYWLQRQYCRNWKRMKCLNQCASGQQMKLHCPQCIAQCHDRLLVVPVELAGMSVPHLSVHVHGSIAQMDLQTKTVNTFHSPKNTILQKKHFCHYFLSNSNSEIFSIQGNKINRKQHYALFSVLFVTNYANERNT